jgi:hypothetical protein
MIYCKVRVQVHLDLGDIQIYNIDQLRDVSHHTVLLMNASYHMPCKMINWRGVSGRHDVVRAIAMRRREWSPPFLECTE